MGTQAQKDDQIKDYADQIRQMGKEQSQFSAIAYDQIEQGLKESKKFVQEY